MIEVILAGIAVIGAALALTAHIRIGELEQKVSRLEQPLDQAVRR